MGNEVWHLKSIACTADGKDVWMIAKNTTSNGNDTVWKSIDYGRNFSRIGLTESRRSLECIVVSDDGGCVYIPMLDSGSAYVMVLNSNGQELDKWQLPAQAVNGISRINLFKDEIFYRCSTASI